MSHPAADPTKFQRTFERVHKGFVTPTQIDGGKISGCVYRADRSKVELSERSGGCRGNLFLCDNPGRLERPVSVGRSSRGLYLGSLMAGHYGHFITEGLSTYWVFENISVGKFDYFLFNPFVFGTKIPSYALKCFDAFGIDPHKVVIMGDSPLAVDELVVPERLLKLNHSADPCLKWVCHEIRKFTSKSAAPVPPVERIYLSRRKISLKQLTRVIASEVLVEKLFRQAGFTVIYPEVVGFEDQVYFYANAKVVAGPSGSSLHNSLFMRTGAQLIELGDPRYGGERAPTQMLCDLISGVEATLIPFVGTIRGDGDSVSFSIRELRSQLLRVLKNINLFMAGVHESRLKTGPLERLECFYLSVRPLVGPTLRKLGLRR